MRFSLASLFIFILFLSTACDPDGFPNREDLVGTWIERSPYSDTLTFRSNGSLIRYRSGSVDTLIFRTHGDRGSVSILNPNSTSQGENEYDVLMLEGNSTMMLVDYRTTSSTNADGIFDRQ